MVVQVDSIIANDEEFLLGKRLIVLFFYLLGIITEFIFTSKIKVWMVLV